MPADTSGNAIVATPSSSATVERAAIARREQGPIGLAGTVVGPDDVDDPAGRQPPGGGPARVAGRQPVREPLDAVRQDRRSAGAVDRAVDTPAAAHCPVGRVDDRIDLLLGDVTSYDVNSHDATLPRGPAVEWLRKAVMTARSSARCVHSTPPGA